MAVPMMPYGINITATWTGGAAAGEAIAAGREVGAVWGEEVPKAADKGAAGFSRATWRMIFGAQMAIFYVSMFVSSLYRAETAAMSVEDAQEDYNKAVQRYGPASQQAMDAARRLERAQLMVDRANLMSIFSTAALGMQFVSLSYQAGILTGAVTALTTALKALWAAAGPWGWAVLVGGVAATGVTSYMIGQQSQINIQSNVQVGEEKDLDKALEEQARKIKEDYRGQKG